MTAGALVDVVVVAWRSAATLPACLTSVTGEPAVAQVVAVDNCSPDDSAQVAAAHGALVIRTERNGGFGAGCNAGAAAGRAPFILLLNPDAAVRPGTVDGLLAYLQRSPRVAVVASELRDGEGRPEPARRRFPAVHRAPLEPGQAAKLDDRWYQRRGRGGPVDWVTGACVLVRRAAFEQVGGFDERFFLYAEETDLCARLTDAGWGVHWVPGFLTDHQSGRSTAGLPAAGKLAWVEGWLRYVHIHAGRPRLMRWALCSGLAGRAAVWTITGKRDRAAMWWSAACHAARVQPS